MIHFSIKKIVFAMTGGFGLNDKPHEAPLKQNSKVHTKYASKQGEYMHIEIRVYV